MYACSVLVSQVEVGGRKALGVKVVYLGPEKFSIRRLVRLLERAIRAEPDGIIITITNHLALDKPLRRAIAKGIPVIAVNVPDPRPREERIPYICYIGQDEYLAGRRLAERILKEYTPRRAVVAIHEPGHVGLEARYKGIVDALKPLGVPVDRLEITTDLSKAMTILKDHIKEHPDLDTIFTLGPLGAHAALKVVEELGVAGRVKIATVDIDDEIIRAIEEGRIVAAVSQQPYMQGFLPVVIMYLHVKYGYIPPDRILTGPTIVDKSNVDLIIKQVKTTGGA